MNKICIIIMYLTVNDLLEIIVFIQICLTQCFCSYTMYVLSVNEIVK